jgi:hypothetical protein
MTTQEDTHKKESTKPRLDKDSVRKAMELAWQDHHHARDQTWKTLQIVAVLAAGLLTIDYTYQKTIPTLCAAILVIIAAAVGVGITWSHRKLERRKFIHIMNCEEYLGLHTDFLIPLDPRERLNKVYPKSTKSQYENEQIKNKMKEMNRDNELFWLKNDSMVGIPNKFKFLDIIHPKKNNTALFILRMHITIIIFCLLVLGFRIFNISIIEKSQHPTSRQPTNRAVSGNRHSTNLQMIQVSKDKNK